jgi:hypothetical protein
MGVDNFAVPSITGLKIEIRCDEIRYLLAEVAAKLGCDEIHEVVVEIDGRSMAYTLDDFCMRLGFCN